jgi:MoxR-like ATPase
MAAEHLPFELISHPPADPTAHRATDKQKLLAQRRLPAFLSSHQQAALRYQPSEALLLAINMALHTGSPLLLTGEPGTGKTQAADFVRAYFDIPIYKFLVKSTSTAQDLMYEFDQHSFPHPFDPTTMICPKSGRPPIVIVTSNEERRLPDAFLRRCIFHRIELTEALIEAAVESMARAAEGDGDGGELSLPRCGDARRSQSAFLGHPPDTGDR